MLPSSSLEVRVGRLEEMPARLDALVAEVADLRGEMRAGFSEVKAEFVAVRRETSEESQRLRTELRGYSDGLYSMVKEHVDEYGGDPSYVVISGGSAGVGVAIPGYSTAYAR